MPSFEVLGMYFKVSKNEANDTFDYWNTIVRELLPPSLLEQVEHQDSDYAVVQELLTEFQLIVDSYEEPRSGQGTTRSNRSIFQERRSAIPLKTKL